MDEGPKGQRPFRQPTGRGARPAQDVAPDLPPHRVQVRSYANVKASLLNGYAPVNLDLVQRLPLPIAHAAEEVAAQRTPDAQIDQVVHVFRSATRFLALVALAQYLRGPVRDPVATGALHRLLSSERISDGQWMGILREALLPYRKQQPRAALPGLVALFFHPGSGQATREGEEFRRWVEFRNLLAHPELPEKAASPGAAEPVSKGRGQSAAERAEEWLGNLAVLLQDLTFLEQYELLLPLSVTLQPLAISTAQAFRGPALLGRFLQGLKLPTTGGGYELEQSVALVPVGRPEQPLLLSPLLIVGAGETLLALKSIQARAERITDAQYVVAATGRDAGSLSDQPRGERHLSDLVQLTAPLGGVGGAAPPASRAVRGYRIGENPWNAIERWALGWVNAGHDYGVVLELDRENDLKAAIASPDVWQANLRAEVSTFILLAALHYRLSWIHWAEQNARSELATEHLLRMLQAANRYHRPRLRALYALQLFDPETVQRVLDAGGWPADTVTLVRRYVVTGRMKEYLQFLATRGAYPLPEKATQVLTEIEPTGAGGIDLPLGPMEDESPPGAPSP